MSLSALNAQFHWSPLFSRNQSPPLSTEVFDENPQKCAATLSPLDPSAKKFCSVSPAVLSWNTAGGKGTWASAVTDESHAPGPWADVRAIVPASQDGSGLLRTIHGPGNLGGLIHLLAEAKFSVGQTVHQGGCLVGFSQLHASTTLVSGPATGTEEGIPRTHPLIMHLRLEVMVSPWSSQSVVQK